jgi:hypothetical protein
MMVNDLIVIADNTYSLHRILGMEKSILNRMVEHHYPTPCVFLVRFAKVVGSDKELEHMVFFFAEMALMEWKLVSLCPSRVASSAANVARCMLKKSHILIETLKHHTGFSELS